MCLEENHYPPTSLSLPFRPAITFFQSTNKNRLFCSVNNVENKHGVTKVIFKGGSHQITTAHEESKFNADQRLSTHTQGRSVKNKKKEGGGGGVDRTH